MSNQLRKIRRHMNTATNVRGPVDPKDLDNYVKLTCFALEVLKYMQDNGEWWGDERLWELSERGLKYGLFQEEPYDPDNTPVGYTEVEPGENVRYMPQWVHFELRALEK